MNRIFAAASTLAVALGAMPSTAGAAELVFKQASPWQVDAGEDYCRLARVFSDGKSEISLAMERIQASNAVRMILVGDAIKMYRGSDQLEFTLAPSGGERKGAFWRSVTPDGQQYLNLGEVFMAPPFQFGAPPPGGAPAGPPPAPPEPGKPLPIPPYSRTAELEYAQGVNALAITGGLMDVVRIETGALKRPMEALQACADDLIAYWGLDAAKHQGMTRPVQPASEANKWLPSGTIGFGDFPKLGGAANQFRIMVSAEGKPTACAVHWPSLEERTNNLICKSIIEKGTFFPALDAQGQPMASYWTVAPFFLMPPFGGT